MSVIDEFPFPFEKPQAQELWRTIAEAAWQCADPGVQYDDTINQWHTCPKSGRINASNPCVTGDTRVLTPGGIWRRIDQMIKARRMTGPSRSPPQNAPLMLFSFS